MQYSVKILHKRSFNAFGDSTDCLLLLIQGAPRFRCATLDRSDQTISQTLPSYQIIVGPNTFSLDQTVVRLKKLCDQSATQKTSDQTIVRPKYFVRLWCDPKFCANLVRAMLPLIRPFLYTCYNPLLFL